MGKRLKRPLPKEMPVEALSTTTKWCLRDANEMWAGIFSHKFFEEVPERFPPMIGNSARLGGRDQKTLERVLPV